jgi:hypothetical protein
MGIKEGGAPAGVPEGPPARRRRYRAADFNFNLQVNFNLKLKHDFMA